MEHSPIGASSCYRWWECPGSVNLCKTVPEPAPSPDAQEGTLAHEFAAWILSDKDRYKFPRYKEITEEMNDAVNAYINFLYAIKKEYKIPDENCLYEHSFNLSEIHPGLWGTGDYVMYEDFGYLFVLDFKYGKGIFVEAENNKQLLYYALGAMSTLKLECPRIVMFIVQPRIETKQGFIRSWEITVDLLAEFAEELEEHARATEKKNAPLNPGDYCKFCPALSVCPAVSSKVQEIARADFKSKEIVLPDACLMSPEELAKVLTFSNLIDDWIRSIYAHAQGMAERGERIPGYKLVPRRANRKWKDEGKVINMFGMLYGDDIYNKKLKSPAQLEKIAGKGELDDYIEVPDIGCTLVPDKDHRDAVEAKNTPLNDFLEIE